MELNDFRILVVTEGAALDAPGVYSWTIDGVGVYVGKYTRKSRPLLEYNNNVRNLISGRPYRKSKADGFRIIHRELAKALLAQIPIRLTIIENCHPTELHSRERELVGRLACGGLNGTK